MFVCTVNIYYIITHACIHFRKISYVHILNIFRYNINYINIDIEKHVNIFKIYTVCVCIYMYINMHSTHTYYYVNNLF